MGEQQTPTTPSSAPSMPITQPSAETPSPAQQDRTPPPSNATPVTPPSDATPPAPSAPPLTSGQEADAQRQPNGQDQTTNPPASTTTVAPQPMQITGVYSAANLEEEWAKQYSPIAATNDPLPDGNHNAKKRPNTEPLQEQPRRVNPRPSTSDSHPGEDSGLEATATENEQHPKELLRFLLTCTEEVKENLERYVEVVDRSGRELQRMMREHYDFASGTMNEIHDNIRNIDETASGKQRAMKVWRHGLEKFERMLSRSNNQSKTLEGDIREWTKRTGQLGRVLDLREMVTEMKKRLADVEGAYQGMEESVLEVKVEEQDVKPFGAEGAPDGNDKETGDE